MKHVYHMICAFILSIFVMLGMTNVTYAAGFTESVSFPHKSHKKANKMFTFVPAAIDNLELLKRVLTRIGLMAHFETLQGIMLVETRAGTGGSVGLPTAHWTRRSYGLMQITLPTARVFLERQPDVAIEYFGKPISKVSNEQLMKQLVNNKEVNIHLGALVFDQYLTMVKGEWARAVAGYNMGIGNALKRPRAIGVKYVADVKEMIGFAKQLNAHLNTFEPTLLAIAPVVQSVELPVVNLEQMTDTDQ